MDRYFFLFVKSMASIVLELWASLNKVYEKCDLFGSTTL